MHIAQRHPAYAANALRVLEGMQAPTQLAQAAAALADPDPEPRLTDLDPDPEREPGVVGRRGSARRHNQSVGAKVRFFPLSSLPPSLDLHPKVP
jgi:hypothetical protein